jgi:hypothetical protein
MAELIRRHNAIRQKSYRPPNQRVGRRGLMSLEAGRFLTRRADIRYSNRIRAFLAPFSNRLR